MPALPLLLWCTKDLQDAVLLHIFFHVDQHGGVLRLFFEILIDVGNGDDGMNVDAKLLLDLHDSGLACVLSNLAAVDRDEHIRDGHFGCALQNRNGFADSGAGGDNILDDDDAVAVLWLVADQAAALQFSMMH